MDSRARFPLIEGLKCSGSRQQLPLHASQLPCLLLDKSDCKVLVCLYKTTGSPFPFRVESGTVRTGAGEAEITRMPQ